MNSLEVNLLEENILININNLIKAPSNSHCPSIKLKQLIEVFERVI
jgi:hypothetical protein